MRALLAAAALAALCARARADGASDMARWAVATASDSHAAYSGGDWAVYGPWRAVDADSGTAWRSQGLSGGAWFDLAFPAPVDLEELRCSWTDYDMPTEWSLEASADGGATFEAVAADLPTAYSSSRDDVIPLALANTTDLRLVLTSGYYDTDMVLEAVSAWGWFSAPEPACVPWAFADHDDCQPLATVMAPRVCPAGALISVTGTCFGDAPYDALGGRDCDVLVPDPADDERVLCQVSGSDPSYGPLVSFADVADLHTDVAAVSYSSARGYCCDFGVYGGANAIDGSTSTYWQSLTDADEWLAFDFGGPYTVAFVGVYWASSYFATDYAIQVSTDYGATWVDSGISTRSDGETSRVDIYDGLWLEGVTQLRVYVTDTYYAGYPPRIREVAIRGAAETAAACSEPHVHRVTSDECETSELGRAACPLGANVVLRLQGSCLDAATQSVTVAGGGVECTPLVDSSFEMYCAVDAQADPVGGRVVIDGVDMTAIVTFGDLLDLHTDVAAVSVSSARGYCCDFGVYGGANAIDGSTSTYWQSLTDADEWLAFDFGGPYTVAFVGVYWASSYFATDYAIQVSTDYGATWVDSGVATYGDGTTYRADVYDGLWLEGVTQLRVYVTDTYYAGYPPRISEVVIRGAAETAAACSEPHVHRVTSDENPLDTELVLMLQGSCLDAATQSVTVAGGVVECTPLVDSGFVMYCAAEAQADPARGPVTIDGTDMTAILEFGLDADVTPLAFDASSAEASYNGAWSTRSASLAMDGASSTYWQSLSDADEWLAFEFGGPYTVTFVGVYWESSYFATDYAIQVSTDYGATWVDSGIATFGDGTSYRADVYDGLWLEGVTQLRVYVTDTYYAGYPPRIREVDIRGIGADLEECVVPDACDWDADNGGLLTCADDVQWTCPVGRAVVGAHGELPLSLAASEWDGSSVVTAPLPWAAPSGAQWLEIALDGPALVVTAIDLAWDGYKLATDYAIELSTDSGATWADSGIATLGDSDSDRADVYDELWLEGVTHLRLALSDGYYSYGYVLENLVVLGVMNTTITGATSDACATTPDGSVLECAGGGGGVVQGTSAVVGESMSIGGVACDPLAWVSESGGFVCDLSGGVPVDGSATIDGVPLRHNVVVHGPAAVEVGPTSAGGSGNVTIALDPGAVATSLWLYWGTSCPPSSVFTVDGVEVACGEAVVLSGLTRTSNATVDTNGGTLSAAVALGIPAPSTAAAEEEINVAKYANVRASDADVAASGDGYLWYGPERAVDDDEDSMWQQAYTTADVWFELDFGVPVSGASSVDLSWGSNREPLAYTVTAGSTALTDDGSGSFAVPAGVDLQVVTVTITDMSSTYGVGLADVEVWAEAPACSAAVVNRLQADDCEWWEGELLCAEATPVSALGFCLDLDLSAGCTALSAYEAVCDSSWATLAPDLRALATASASSSQASGTVEVTELDPALAIDGDAVSYWVSYVSDGEWLELDLGAPYALSTLFLNWGSYGPAAYSVLVDGVVAAEVASSDASSTRVDLVRQLNATGQVVRVAFEELIYDSYGCRVAELGLWGTGSGSGGTSRLEADGCAWDWRASRLVCPAGGEYEVAAVGGSGVVAAGVTETTTVEGFKVLVEDVQDLRLLAAVTASSVAGLDVDPQWAADGDADTRWYSSFDSEWVELSFASNFTLTAVSFYWGAEYAGPSEWTVLVDGVELAALASSETAASRADLLAGLEGVVGSSLRVEYDAMAHPTYGTSLAELGVYGYASAACEDAASAARLSSPDCEWAGGQLTCPLGLSAAWLEITGACLSLATDVGGDVTPVFASADGTLLACRLNTPTEFWETTVLGLPLVAADVVADAPVSATASGEDALSSTATYAAANAVDGDASTVWASSQSSAWLDVDLGGEMLVQDVTVAWTSAAGVVALLADGVEVASVESSDDSRTDEFGALDVVASVLRLEMSGALSSSFAVSEVSVSAAAVAPCTEAAVLSVDPTWVGAGEAAVLRVTGTCLTLLSMDACTPLSDTLADCFVSEGFVGVLSFGGSAGVEAVFADVLDLSLSSAVSDDDDGFDFGGYVYNLSSVGGVATTAGTVSLFVDEVLVDSVAVAAADDPFVFDGLRLAGGALRVDGPASGVEAWGFVLDGDAQAPVVVASTLDEQRMFSASGTTEIEVRGSAVQDVDLTLCGYPCEDWVLDSAAPTQRAWCLVPEAAAVKGTVADVGGVLASFTGDGSAEAALDGETMFVLSGVEVACPGGTVEASRDNVTFFELDLGVCGTVVPVVQSAVALRAPSAVTAYGYAAANCSALDACCDLECGVQTCDAVLADGEACASDAQCLSGQCWDGVCVSCVDGVRNGNESAVDCGGAFCDGCALGLACQADSDCESGTCAPGVCREALLEYDPGVAAPVAVHEGYSAASALAFAPDGLELTCESNDTSVGVIGDDLVPRGVFDEDNAEREEQPWLITCTLSDPSFDRATAVYAETSTVSVEAVTLNVVWPFVADVRRDGESALLALGGGTLVTAVGRLAPAFAAPLNVTLGGVAANVSSVSGTLANFTVPTTLPSGYTTLRIANQGGLGVAAVADVYVTDECPAGSLGSSVTLRRGEACLGSLDGDEACAYGSASTGCSVCPEGAYCPGGVRLWPRAGFWIEAESSDLGSLSGCREPADERCLGYDEASGTWPCGAAYTGTLCDLCKPDFYELFNECVECPDGLARLVLPLLFLAAGAAGCFVVVAWLARRFDLAKDFCVYTLLVSQVCLGWWWWWGPPGSHNTNHTKTLAQVGHASLSQNEALQSTYRVLMLFQLDVGGVAHPSCVSTYPFLGELVGFSLALYLTLALALLTWKPARERWDALFPAALGSARVRGAATLLLVVGHLQACNVALRLVACAPNAVDGRWRMLANPGIECYAGEHTAAAALAWAVLLFYSLGFPVGMYRYMSTREDLTTKQSRLPALGRFLNDELKAHEWVFVQLNLGMNAVLALTLAVYGARWDAARLGINVAALALAAALWVARRPYAPLHEWKLAVKVGSLLLAVVVCVLNYVSYPDGGVLWLSWVVLALIVGLYVGLGWEFRRVVLRGAVVHDRRSEAGVELAARDSINPLHDVQFVVKNPWGQSVS